MQGMEAAVGDWDEILATEHDYALAIFDKMLATDETQTFKRKMLLMKLTHALDKHAHQEEMVVYPALREANEAADADHLEGEHGYIKTFIYGLAGNQTGAATVRFATATAASLLFPFAPHLGAEVYESLMGDRVWEQPWPEADPDLLERDTYMLVVQVNGKLRDRIEVASDTAESDLVDLAKGSENVQRHLDGKPIVKEIVVPGRLVNLVVKG